MQMEYFPEIVQVSPHEDYTVSVYFSDGKIVLYDVSPFLDKGIFRTLKDKHIFMDCCTIMNDSLAWDINKNRDPSDCIDIDPDTLYELEAVNSVTVPV